MTDSQVSTKTINIDCMKDSFLDKLSKFDERVFKKLSKIEKEFSSNDKP